MSTKPSVTVKPPVEQPNESVPDFLKQLETAIRAVQGELQKKRRFPDPVRTKNMEKIADHLHHALAYLPSKVATWKSQSMQISLEQLKNKNAIERLSSQQVWELADFLETELLEFADDMYLYRRLTALWHGDQQVILASHFPDFEAIVEDYQHGSKFTDVNRSRVRAALISVREALINEYRRDRAKIGLRNRQLNFLVVFLFVFLFLFGSLYAGALSQAETGSAWHLTLSLISPTENEPGNVLVAFHPEEPWRSFALLIAFVAVAGALGGILSRAIRLSKQPLHEAGNAALPPLGIRDLMSNWGIIVAQPFIGATSALFLFLAFQSGFIATGQAEWGASQYGLIGFLAGFSEPFFLNIVGQLENQWGGQP
ncbi:MAG: hypothetical protein K8J31_02360 [Anaerolineae bacterium]|nr:hypothetical protein [Anaerolineae bacterium]